MVTHDGVGTLAGFARRRAISYPLLSDADAEIIPAFGLASRRYPEGSPFYGVAESFIAVVDAGGVVRHRFSRPYTGAQTVLDAVADGGS